jgi:hypothetical protein
MAKDKKPAAPNFDMLDDRKKNILPKMTPAQLKALKEKVDQVKKKPQ